LEANTKNPSRTARKPKSSQSLLSERRTDPAEAAQRPGLHLPQIPMSECESEGICKIFLHPLKMHQ